MNSRNSCPLGAYFILFGLIVLAWLITPVAAKTGATTVVADTAAMPPVGELEATTVVGDTGPTGSAQTGACCLPNGECVNRRTKEECDDLGGVWHEDENCRNVECPQPEVGACCLPDGSCKDDWAEVKCEDKDGEWHEGKKCRNVDCPQPTGACCRPSGSCTGDLNEAECEAEGGVKWHEGKTCDEVNCPVGPLHWDGEFGIPGMDKRVTALAATQEESNVGPGLYAGGPFSRAGKAENVNGVAMWNGKKWLDLDEGLEPGQRVNALVVATKSSRLGPALYAGGTFWEDSRENILNFIAKWDGTSWSKLGGGMSAFVFTLAVSQNGAGKFLYAGGDFFRADDKDVWYIAEWDGNAWFAMDGGMSAIVHALVSPEAKVLYAGGDFEEAGGVEVNHVALWNGNRWSSLKEGVNGPVFALAMFDSGRGDGEELYAAGIFSEASGKPASHIAKWTGEKWKSLPPSGFPQEGVDFDVFTLTVFDDGDGDNLYVGGASNIARWEGRKWVEMDGEMESEVLALTRFDDGTEAGNALYAGGSFEQAGKGFCESNYIGRWGRGVAEDCVLNCLYKVKKKSKGKNGCPREACPQRGDIFPTENACETMDDCENRIKIRRWPCPVGEKGRCTKIKGKRDSCE